MALSVFEMNSVALLNDPFPELQRLLDAGPIVKTKIPIIGSTWTLTSYSAVDEFLRDSKRFVRDPAKAGKKLVAGMQWWMPAMFRALAQNMMARDGDDHRRLRLLVEKAFARRNVDGMRAHIVEVVDELVDQMGSNTSNDGHVDFVEYFARELPLAVICELLGLPDSDRPKFRNWFAPISKVSSLIGFFRIMPGMFKLKKYLVAQIEQCRKQPREGLISALIEAEESGDQLSHDELVAMIFLLLIAGHETTTHLLSGGLLTLLDHPAERHRLCADWSLAESAIDEILRYTTPVQMCKPRYAVEDLELYGHTIRRGEFVTGFLASANVDPAEFSNPQQFDITRSPNRHVSFGKGIHTCLGLRLAHMETEVAFQRLFDRYPEIQLAVPRDTIPWSSRVGMRTLARLPVRLSG